MNEREVIQKAFEASLSQVYMAFREAYTNAQGNPAAEQKAITKFRDGVVHVRHVRDLALANLPA